MEKAAIVNIAFSSELFTYLVFFWTNINYGHVFPLVYLQFSWSFSHPMQLYGHGYHTHVPVHDRVHVRAPQTHGRLKNRFLL